MSTNDVGVHFELLGTRGSVPNELHRHTFEI